MDVRNVELWVLGSKSIETYVVETDISSNMNFSEKSSNYKSTQMIVIYFNL